jgi:phage virion morphogenesis protein
VVRIQVNDNQLSATLTRLERQLNDLTPAFKAIGEYYLRRTDDGFRSETNPYGQPWAPLAASTLKQKARKNRIPKTLQSRGIMRASTSYQATSRSVLIGFATNYAQYHQFGTKKMAQRMLLPSNGLPQQDQNAITDILANLLDN